MLRIFFALSTFFVYLPSFANDCGLGAVQIENLQSQQNDAETDVAGFVVMPSGKKYEFSFKFEFKPHASVFKLQQAFVYRFEGEKAFAQAILPNLTPSIDPDASDVVVELHIVKLEDREGKTLLTVPHVHFKKMNQVWEFNKISFSQIPEL